MKALFKLSCLLLFSLLLTACGGSNGEEETPTLIDPSDVNALSRALLTPEGTLVNGGNPPTPSNSNLAPTVNNLFNDIVSSNGSTAPLNFEYANVNGNLAGCYVQIEGSDVFFTVPYNATSSNGGGLLLPLGIPVNVTAGEFDVNFCVYDDNGLVSNVVSTTVSVLRLGTGSLQISLSWDDTTDQDLYVTDPSGETISYRNRRSESGGELDRDDTNGYGPENIYWTENAPDGSYSVSVDAFSSRSTPTTFYVTISTGDDSQSFTGTTVNGSTEDVVTFVKNGSSLAF